MKTGIWEKVVNLFTLNSEEDDMIGYDEYERANYVDGAVAYDFAQEEPRNDGGVFGKGRKRQDREEKRGNHKVTPFRKQGSDNHSSHVAIIKPKGMDDSSKIADTLLEGYVVLINYGGLDTRICQRISDFVSGVVYSVNGRIVEIAPSIQIAVPSDVSLDGDFQEALGNSVSVPSLRAGM